MNQILWKLGYFKRKRFLYKLNLFVQSKKWLSLLHDCKGSNIKGLPAYDPWPQLVSQATAILA